MYNTQLHYITQVSHEWTDYGHVQNMYSDGHEIASHSISHRLCFGYFQFQHRFFFDLIFEWNIIEVLARFAFIFNFLKKSLFAVLESNSPRRSGWKRWQGKGDWSRIRILWMCANAWWLRSWELCPPCWSVLSRRWRNVSGRSLRLMEESILKTSVECALPSLPLGFLLFKIFITIVNNGCWWLCNPSFQYNEKRV